MQRCQFAGHVIGRALCLFCDPALPAFEGRGPIKTSLLDDLPRLDRGKATEDDLHAVGGGVELDVVPRSDDIGGEIVGGALRLVFAARVIEYLPPAWPRWSLRCDHRPFRPTCRRRQSQERQCRAAAFLRTGRACRERKRRSSLRCGSWLRSFSAAPICGGGGRWFGWPWRPRRLMGTS